MQSIRGFTLIELMVTIALLAVIAMMAAPSFSNLLAKQQLNSTTQDLISTLNEARSAAVLKRASVTVTLLSSDSIDTNTDTQYYWSSKTSTTNNTLTSPASLSSIIFLSNGATSSITSDTSFVICNSTSHTTRTFSLSVMGTVYATPANDGAC